MNYKTKSTNKIRILILILVSAIALGIMMALPLTASAATNQAGEYTISGTYDIGNGSVSGYKSNFTIRVSTQYFKDDSSTSTLYNGHVFDWSYFNFYINPEDILYHASFKLTRNGTTYTSKSLSGNGSGYLYQGALPDGEYVLTYSGVYQENILLSKIYTFTYTFTVDTTAPTVNLKAGTSTASSGSYTNKAITASYSDANNYRLYYRSPGSSSYSYTIGTSKSVTATSANNGWWYFYAVDEASNTSATAKIYLDTVAPVGKITNSSGTTIASGGYTNKPVKYTATDTGGVSYYQVKNPGSSSWSSYAAGTALSSATGWYTFRAVDKAGNVSGESKVYYDPTVPTGQLYSGVSKVDSGKYSKSSSIKYEGLDGQSGISKCYVLLPGASTYTEYTALTQLKDEGVYKFYCLDLAGNKSAVSTITLDRTDAVGKLYAGSKLITESETYTNAAYVKYVATDSLSGVGYCFAKLPGESYYSDYVSGTQLKAEGTYSFYCADNAKNRCSTIIITIDRTAPYGQLYSGENAIESGKSTNAEYIKFIGWDNCEVLSVYVLKPGATSYVSYYSNTKLTEAGEYKFYVKDMASNASQTYTITLDREIPSAQLYVDGEPIGSGSYTNGTYISFECDETCYVKMPGSDTFVSYVSGIEFSKPGKYVFKGVSDAGNSTGEYTVVIDQVIKQANILGVTNGYATGDVTISWTDGDLITTAPIVSVTVNGKAVTNGTKIYTIEGGKYLVNVVDAAGNEWASEFVSTKKNVFTQTLVKEYFEVHDINGDLFAFTTYDKALEFATAREKSKVRTAEWNNSAWDTGVPMDSIDAVNARNGLYHVYYKSGNPEELVAYFTAECLNEVIAEYAKEGINSYYYWEKAPATAGPDENLYSYSADRNILASEVLLGENIGVAVDGESFIGTVYNTEGKHVMVISDSYGNTNEYNLTVIRTLPDLHYAIGDGEAVKVDLGRTYYFKDEITISITDKLDEMAMFNVYDEDGDLVGSYSLGETCTLSGSGSYTAVSVNHSGESEKFKIVISRNAPSAEFEADAEAKRLVITVIESIDKESHLQSFDLYKSTDSGETWELLQTDDYGTAIELDTLTYRFRTSGMYKVVITDEFRTGMDSISVQTAYSQPDPTGTLEGVENNGYTNKAVAFTWKDEAMVTVMRDGVELEYKSGDKLTDDGNYTLILENYDGYKYTYEFIIDTVSPQLIIEGHKADIPVNTPVKVDIVDSDITAVLFKNGVEVGEYISGTPVIEEGKYKVVATDQAQNISEIEFEIDTSVDFDINIYDGGLSNGVLIELYEQVEVYMTINGKVYSYDEDILYNSPGKYTLKITDALMNTVEMTFTIVPEVSTGFSHNFDDTVGFEKVIVNGEEIRLNYGNLELTEDGTYEVGVVVDGKTYTFTTSVDRTVDYAINVHNKGFANSATLVAGEDIGVEATRNGEAIKYKVGDKLDIPGEYTLKITDSLGNEDEISFTIIEPVYVRFEQEIDKIPGFEKVTIDEKEISLDKGTLLLDKDGSYIVEIFANGKSYVFTVNIDSTVDCSVNVHDKGFANSVSITAAEDVIVSVTKNGEAMEYELDAAITEPALYMVKLTDTLGNTKELSFTVIENHYYKFEQELDNIPGFEGVKVNGNDYTLDKGTLALTDSGEYVVDVTANGATYSFTVNIDSAVDYTIDVHDKGLANTVTLNSNEELTVTVTKDGEEIEYELGTTLTEVGTYTVKMVDEYGNTKELSFTIIESLYANFEQEIDEMPGFEKVLVNGEEVILEKGTLALTESGTYEITIVAKGNEQKFSVVVDSTVPVVTVDGVENGGTTKGAVTLTDLSSDATMKVYLDDELIEYNLGDELTDVGVYRIVLEDAVGNVNEYSFEILWKFPTVAIIFIVIAVLGVAGTVVWLVISKKRKDEYYN